MSLITSFEYRTDRTARFAEHNCGWFYVDIPDGGQVSNRSTYRW